MNKLEEILNTPDVSNIGHFIDVDLKHPDKSKEKARNLPFAPEKKVIRKDDYNDCMKKIKPKKYLKAKN